MCGIGGVSSFDKSQYDPRLHLIMTNLGLKMQERGRKSWGWSNGDRIVKSLGEFADGWNGSFYGTSEAILHTRHPTTGALIADNSHPFRVGDVIGVHNGCVYNHDALKTKYERIKVQVDSEHIFYHINENRPLTDINAYGAIVYWRDGKIHFGRFNGGTLFLARAEDKFWVFASTEESIRQSLRFAGVRDFVMCKLREGQEYILDGANLVTSGLLEFGEYKSSYGTWETRGGSGSGSSGYQGYYQPGKTLTVPATTQTPVPLASSKLSETGTKTLTLEESVGQMISATVGRKKSLMSQQSPKSQESTTNSRASLISDEIDWKCAITGEIINAGDAFYVDIHEDLVSAEAASKMDEGDLLSKTALRTLPLDIYKLSSRIGVNDLTALDLREFTCDSCDSILMLDDTVAEMPDGELFCIDCFANGDAEDDEAAEYNDMEEVVNENEEDLGEPAMRANYPHYTAAWKPGEEFDYKDTMHTIFTDKEGNTTVTDLKTGEVMVFPMDSFIPQPIMKKIVDTMNEMTEAL